MKRSVYLLLDQKTVDCLDVWGHEPVFNPRSGKSGESDGVKSATADKH